MTSYQTKTFSCMQTKHVAYQCTDRAARHYLQGLTRLAEKTIDKQSKQWNLAINNRATAYEDPMKLQVSKRRSPIHRGERSDQSSHSLSDWSPPKWK